MRISKLSTSLLAGTLLTMITLPALAQRVPANYTMITYRKVAPEKVEAFLAFTKSQTKKVSQARVDSGGIKGWSLLKLTAPYATGSDFNYALVVYSTTYPDLDPDAADVAAVFQKAGVNRAEYLKQSRDLSSAVSQNIARTALRVGAVAEVGDFVRVDYHSTPADRQGELFEIEERIYAPMFKNVIEAGKGPRAWSVATPILPLGTELGYSFYTTQVYKDNAGLGRGLGLSQEVFTKAHPTLNYMNTMQRVRELDKIVKVRIYRVLDIIGSPVVPR